MGKSPASCFKIIACGGASVDHGDLRTPDSKGSSDRGKWSFRKRSARHRVLSNNVSSETPLPLTKETPESPVSFQVQPVPEKASVIQLTEEKTPVIQLTEEKTNFPAQLESKLSDALSALEDDCKADEIPDESSIIIIQAAIRRLLAEQVLLRQKSIVKLQAAVRGHIVRRYAVGTLRCVQSIIKMQALVRARRTGQLAKVPGDSFEQSEISGKGKREAKPNDIHTYVSIDKLLSNAFARQLMESTPRIKPINIKCDPSKSDLTWKWLERWMSVSSVRHKGPQESGSPVKHHRENLVHSDVEEDSLVLSNCYAESADLASSMGEAVEEVSENHNNLIISRDSSDVHLHSGKITQLECEVIESAPTDMEETYFIEMAQVESLSEKQETGNELHSEQPEADVKKLLKKASNPAFIAAKSKFEELSSAPTSTKLTSSSIHTLGVESGLELDKVSPATFAVQNSSECGTELSISSTFDSPDSSVNGIEHEEKFHSNKTDGQPKSGEMFEIEAIEKSPTLETSLSSTSENDSTRYESINSAIVAPLNSINDDDLPRVERNQEANLIDQQLDLESERKSQVSIKPKKIKGQKSEPNLKKKSSSTGKNHYQDSGLTSSLEQLPEPKSGKRRNSFGSAKLDHEPRDSSSSNSLPSYMQATLSAKAKALIVANGSPISSPDVSDRDIYLKKRHSLSGNNERQCSPRVQRFTSQAQENAKGNVNNSNSNSPQDRKWRR